MKIDLERKDEPYFWGRLLGVMEFAATRAKEGIVNYQSLAELKQEYLKEPCKYLLSVNEQYYNTALLNLKDKKDFAALKHEHQLVMELAEYDWMTSGKTFDGKDAETIKEASELEKQYLKKIFECSTSIARIRNLVRQTQEELAKNARVSVRTLQYWEQGKSTPTSVNLKALARELECDAWDLI